MPVASAVRKVAIVGHTQLLGARHRATTTSALPRRQCCGGSGTRSASTKVPAQPPPTGAPKPTKPTRASIFSMYNSLLESRPLATKAVTSGAIAFAGDVSCQLLALEVAKREEEHSSAQHVDDHEQHEPFGDGGATSVASEIDWGRTLRFTFVGAAVVAPALHAWYGFLIRRLPGTAPATVVKRVALDQLLFAPVFLAVFLSTVMLLDGNAAKIDRKLRADYPTTVVSNWGYWIPAQVINFRFVAPVYQVLYANFVGFFWNIYLSYQSNKAVLKDMEHPAAVDVTSSHK